MQELAVNLFLKFIIAAVIFYAGWKITGVLRGLIVSALTRRKLDPMLVSFSSNVAYIVLLLCVIIAALSQLGVQTTSFIAIIGAAGLAIGLALQNSLSNFAAGMMIILFRPFKLGDYIEAAGVGGIVEGIQIFSTQLRSADNKAIIIPNASITSGNITNFSAKPERRVDLVFGISYEDDIKKAKQVLREILDQEKRILREPAPIIAVSELADSCVKIAVRPWVRTEDYWDVYWALTETVKLRFDAEGISIPYPQRHIYMHQVS